MKNTTRALTVALAAGLAAPAFSQTDIFWNAGSGVWNAPGNWSPVNVPNAANENAFILSPAFAVVTLDFTATIGSLEVAPQITLTMDPSSALIMNGDITNNGFITLNPSANVNNAAVQFNSSGTLMGNGILRLSGGGNDAQLTTNGTTITNALGHTIDGAGQIPASLINNSVISAIDTGFGNRLELISAAKTNNLNMQAGPNAELFISSTTINQAPGATISANSGGTVIFNGSNTINGGRFVGTGEFVKPSSGNLSLADVSIEQDLDVAPAAGVLYNSSTLNCTGTITLNDSESVNNAFVQFNASTLVTGGGSIFLAGGGIPGTSNDSAVSTNGTMITIDNGFTIEGSGELTASLVNNGMIRAFPSLNGDGRLRLFSSSKTNNSLILADTGGVIEINSITITQDPAGEILADGGGIEFVASQTVNGGTIRTANGGTLVKPTSGNLSMSDVSLQGDLSVLPSAGVLYNSPAFDCQGTITLNNSLSANNAFIQFNASTTVSGGGTFFLGGSGNDSQVNTNGTVMTIAPDFTIEGSGQLNAAVVNNGLIRAFPSDFGDGRLRLGTSSKTNNALIRADTGGVIEINSITITQGPAGEILADGGVIEFAASQTINGGTIRTANGGSLTKPPSGNLSMSDIFLDGDLDIATSAGVLYNSALFTTTGSVNLNDSASANNSFMQFNASTTLTGGGRIFLGGSFDDSQVNTNGTVMTIAPDFTVEGSGQLNAAVVNNGLIRAFPSEFGDGRLRLATNSKTNNAVMRAETDGVLEINSITLTQGVGGETVADGGVVEFVASQTVNGGTLRSENGGRFRKLASGNLSLGSDITLETDLELEGSSGMFVTTPTMTNNGSIRINSNGSANNTFVQFNASTVIDGTGRIFLEGAGNDSQLLTNGTVATFGPGQTLEGEGIMNGSYIVQGRVAPGLPVGRITGAGTVTFADSTLIIAETTGPGVGDGFSYTSGTFNLDGDVSVRLNGYIPQINDQFNLITASTMNGLFDDVFVSAGMLPTNIAVRLVYTPSTVDVRFVCLADLAPPFGVLDLADVTGFTSAFLAQDPLADLAEPIGVFDLADIAEFVTNFLSNCN